MSKTATRRRFRGRVALPRTELMSNRTLHRMLLGLIGLTVLALLWNRYGMDAVLEINAHSPYELRPIDDRRESTGRSVAAVRRENGRLVLDCTIKAGYEWPYCELAIDLKQPPAGVDLTRYETVRLWVRSEGPEPQQQVRFFIRNFNPAFSKVGDDLSMKVQEIIYNPDPAGAPIEVKLSQFTVASWWTSERTVPVRFAGTEFDNVPLLELSTGGNVVPGRHRISVERIEFRGKIIPAAMFRLLIIGTWVLSVISYLAIDRWATRRRLIRSERHQSSLKRINESLRLQTHTFAKLARQDLLTGLLNRKGLGDELVRVARDGDAQLFPLSLVFIDIDHFKKINDEHGHSVGDQVIRDLASVIRTHIQRDDLIARWGGEEFLLICRLTRSHEAALIAERLRHVIATREWPSGIRVTSSFGVAESVMGEDLSESIKRADEAMYRAKQKGRDRVEVQLAGPPAVLSSP